jgi:YHS domain-containing protein
MALFDRMGGLLGNLGDYGFGLPSNIGGLVADEDRDAINKRALLSGLISAGLTYAATPKNLNTGSALPYLGRAGLAGFGASQDVIDRSLNTAYRNKLIAGRDDNIRTYEKDRQKITEQFDPITKTWTPLGISSIDAPKEAKEPTLPNLAQEYEYAVSKGYKGKFEDWKKLSIDARLAAEMPLKTQESEYRYGTPQQSISVNAGGKTYYFKDQNSANLFRQKAGIK